MSKPDHSGLRRVGAQTVAGPVRRIRVSSPAALSDEARGYLADGYSVANQGLTTITLVKQPRPFRRHLMVIGLVLGIIPGVLYVMFWSKQPGDVVELGFDSFTDVGATNAGVDVGAIGIPGSGYTSWQASQPRDSAAGVAAAGTTSTVGAGIQPMLQLSPDGRQWWDGSRWRDVPDSEGSSNSQDGSNHQGSSPSASRGSRRA